MSSSSEGSDSGSEIGDAVDQVPKLGGGKGPMTPPKIDRGCGAKAPRKALTEKPPAPGKGKGLAMKQKSNELTMKQKPLPKADDTESEEELSDNESEAEESESELSDPQKDKGKRHAPKKAKGSSKKKTKPTSEGTQDDETLMNHVRSKIGYDSIYNIETHLYESGRFLFTKEKHSRQTKLYPRRTYEEVLRIGKDRILKEFSENPSWTQEEKMKYAQDMGFWLNEEHKRIFTETHEEKISQTYNLKAFVIYKESETKQKPKKALKKETLSKKEESIRDALWAYVLFSLAYTDKDKTKTNLNEVKQFVSDNGFAINQTHAKEMNPEPHFFRYLSKQRYSFKCENDVTDARNMPEIIVIMQDLSRESAILFAGYIGMILDMEHAKENESKVDPSQYIFMHGITYYTEEDVVPYVKKYKQHLKKTVKQMSVGLSEEELEDTDFKLRDSLITKMESICKTRQIPLLFLDWTELNGLFDKMEKPFTEKQLQNKDTKREYDDIHGSLKGFLETLLVIRAKKRTFGKIASYVEKHEIPDLDEEEDKETPKPSPTPDPVSPPDSPAQAPDSPVQAGQAQSQDTQDQPGSPPASGAPPASGTETLHLNNDENVRLVHETMLFLRSIKGYENRPPMKSVQNFLKAFLVLTQGTQLTEMQMLIVEEFRGQNGQASLNNVLTTPERIAQFVKEVKSYAET